MSNASQTQYALVTITGRVTQNNVSNRSVTQNYAKQLSPGQNARTVGNSILPRALQDFGRRYNVVPLSSPTFVVNTNPVTALPARTIILR